MPDSAGVQKETGIVPADQVTGSRPERKIAIFGTTPSRMEGPWQDDSGWERWTIGPGGKDTHGWDRLFETHGALWPEEFKEYLNDLSKVELPQQVCTIAPMPSAVERWAHTLGKDEDWLKETITGKWKANVVIDREALYEKYRRSLFQSSIDYALAMAIEEGATDIGCWGIDLESGEEYVSQWFSATTWLMLARLAGVNLYMPSGSGLDRDLTPYPDRYETHLALTLEKKQKWLDGLIGNAERDYEGTKAEMHRIEGVLRYQHKLNAGIALGKHKLPKNTMGDEIKIVETDLVNLNNQLGQQAANANHLKGEKSATDYYRRMYCWGMVEPT